MLTVAGVQVPLIPFIEVDGKIGAVLPLQIVLNCAKEGAIFSVTVCVRVVGTAHWFPFGVKV